jgi:hypothetical protein
MTQQTIDILKDCELWCDFDTAFIDEQRGIVRDRSGHGRHPVAEGGPTFGANGPDSFEAVSLDGVDDYFDLPEKILIPDGNEWSVVCFSNPKDDNTSRGIITSKGNASTLSYDTKNDNIRFTEADFDIINMGVTEDISVSNRVTVTCDGTQFNAFVNGRFEDRVQSANTTKLVVNEIARRASGPSHYNGNTSFLGVWNRELSNAEIDYLNRLTAPRRAQL